MNVDSFLEGFKALEFDGLSEELSFSSIGDHLESLSSGQESFFPTEEISSQASIDSTNVASTSNPIKELLKAEESKNICPEDYFKCKCESTVHVADLELHSTYCSYFQPYVLAKKIVDPAIFIANGLPPPRSPIKLRLRKTQSGRKHIWHLGFKQNTVKNQPNCKMSSDSGFDNSVTNNADHDQQAMSSGQEDSRESNATGNPGDAPSPTPSAGHSLPEIDESVLRMIVGEVPEMYNSTNDEGPEGDTQTNGSISPRPNSKASGDEKEEEHTEEKKLKSEGENEESKSSTENSAPVNTTGTNRIRMRSMDDLMATSEVKVEEPDGPLSALNVMISDLKTPQIPKSTFEPLTSLSMTTVIPPPSLPPSNPSSMPNLPPGVSLQKRPPPSNFLSGVTITKHPRRDSESSSASSLSPSATPPPPRLPEGITLVRPGQSKSQDPVANLLASRGVSVMSSQQTSIKKMPSTSSPQIRNNGALTITTATPPKRPPQSSPIATVDLTDDSVLAVRRPPPVKPRMPLANNTARPRPASVTCDVCDKVFAHADALRAHMQTHAPGRRPIAPVGMGMRQPAPAQNGLPPSNSFQCRFCIARYPNQSSLSQHMQRFHPDKFGGSIGSEFALPVVDLSDSRTMNNLVSLGVKFCIPLGNLSREEGGGIYGVPVVPMESATNPAVCSLGRLNCSNLLPLGPMKGVMRQ